MYRTARCYGWAASELGFDGLTMIFLRVSQDQHSFLHFNGFRGFALSESGWWRQRAVDILLC